jgi:nitrite reductase/ring-hydroxylating ferredoxin subunit
MAAQECPHSSYPLSNGTPFDIEDFGVVLSSGIQCPKHDWSFDLHTGRSDRGNYKLQVWEIQERPAQDGNGAKDVWVRRKQRIG